MSAKRKLLPRPCPKCRSPYGTIQIVYLPAMRTKIHTNIDYEARKVTKEIVQVSGSSKGFVIRIGHYIPEHYRQIKDENDDPYNYASDEEKKKKLKASERLWCSFRSDHLEDDLDLKWSYDGVMKPVNMPISNSLWNKVVNEGWKVEWPKISLKPHTHTYLD